MSGNASQHIWVEDAAHDRGGYWVRAQGTSNGAAHVTSPALIFKTENTGTYTYYGEAVPGSADGDAVWQLSRKTNADGTILYKSAGAFSNTWTDRASGTYA